MRTTRRRSRLRSGQYPGDRWRPSIPAAVLVVGLAVGCFLGLRGRWFNQSSSLQEHYVLLASDLYAQGAPLPDIRDRLVAVGYTNPSDSVLTVANRLAGSHDAVQQQESDQLHQFAEALVAGLDKEPIGTPVAGAPSTPVATPAVTDTPVAPTATPIPADTPASTPPADTPTVVAPPAVAVAPAASASQAAPASVGAGKGVVKTNDRKPGTLRKAATSKSAAVGILPYGSTVQILGSVSGEAVNAGNSRWYHVRAGTHEGYVYSSLIQAGG